MFKSSVASRLFGLFASKEFPSRVQVWINKFYIKLTKVDLSEHEPIESYESLNALFTRKLKVIRTFEDKEDEFISPCDAFISECGMIEEERALQIKGHLYRVKELLGDFITLENKEKIMSGKYINFYLSPKDYHRFHVPIEMKITKAIHIPGKLYPVNLKWLEKVSELFIQNERVILECFTKSGVLFYMVFVGALNVGKIRFVFDELIHTNKKGSKASLYSYENLWLKKGEELGFFEMGSTIVMFFQKNSVQIECNTDQNIKFTDKIAKIIHNSLDDFSF